MLSEPDMGQLEYGVWTNLSGRLDHLVKSSTTHNVVVSADLPIPRLPKEDQPQAARHDHPPHVAQTWKHQLPFPSSL